MTCVRVIKHRCCCSLNLLTIIFDVLFSYTAAPPQHSLFNLWLILGHTHRCIRQFRSETPKVSFIMNKVFLNKENKAFAVANLMGRTSNLPHNSYPSYYYSTESTKPVQCLVLLLHSIKKLICGTYLSSKEHPTHNFS